MKHRTSLLLLAAVLLAGCGTEAAVEPTPEATIAPYAGESPAPTQSAAQRLRSELRKLDDRNWKYKSLTFVRSNDGTATSAWAVSKTPEGGFKGPSTDDVDRGAAVAIQAAHEAGWRRKLLIQFEGGASYKATGEEDPDYVMATFVITGAEMRAIKDWSDDNVLYGGIDWSVYRTQTSTLLRN